MKMNALTCLKSFMWMMTLSVSMSAWADYKTECVRAIGMASPEQTEACGAIQDEFSLSCVRYLGNQSPDEIRSCGTVNNEYALQCVNAFQSYREVDSRNIDSSDIERCSKVVTSDALTCAILLPYPNFEGFESCYSQ